MTRPSSGSGASPDQRSLCALVLDTSLSMTGEPVARLNEGLVVLEEVLRRDREAARRVELCVVAAGGGGPEVASGWCRAADFVAPELDAGGGSPLGLVMAMALDLVAARHAALEATAVACTRPWIVMTSDGAPDDIGWMKEARRCRDADRRREVNVFPVGIDGADLQALAAFSRKQPKRLKARAFDRLFLWLGRCLCLVAAASPGARVKLPAPTWTVEPAP